MELMKKRTAYIGSILLLTALLCGCGKNNVTNGVTASPVVTPAVTATVTPTHNNDGVVKDNDGIIDETVTDNVTAKT